MHITRLSPMLAHHNMMVVSRVPSTASETDVPVALVRSPMASSSVMTDQYWEEALY